MHYWGSGANNLIGKNRQYTMVTIIIIVKNEEEKIGSILDQLSWADECVVVDNGSDDNTAHVAQKHGAKTTTVEGVDFSKLRNVGVKMAKNKWVLYLDTDEYISVELKNEILDITKTTPTSNEFSAYRLLRKNYYLGHEWPQVDGMIRLIYKDSLIEWYGALHETAKISGSVGTLKNLLTHKTHTSLEKMVVKTNMWSEIEAKLRFDSKHPRMAAWRFFRVMLSAFYTSYVIEGGFRVGTVGVIESIYQSFSIFITYAKLWELQNKNHNKHI